MIYKNHNLSSMRNSNYIFHCKNCNNIIKGEVQTKDGFQWWYYLNFEKGGFWPLNDCNEMIIKDIIE